MKALSQLEVILEGSDETHCSLLLSAGGLLIPSIGAIKTNIIGSETFTEPINSTDGVRRIKRDPYQIRQRGFRGRPMSMVKLEQSRSEGKPRSSGNGKEGLGQALNSCCWSRGKEFADITVLSRAFITFFPVTATNFQAIELKIKYLLQGSCKNNFKYIFTHSFRHE